MGAQETLAPTSAEIIARVPLGERIRIRVGRFLAYALITLVSVPIVVMYVWLFMQSVSTRVLLGFIPEHITFENWRFLWSKVTIGARTYSSIWPVSRSWSFW